MVALQYAVDALVILCRSVIVMILDIGASSH